MAEMASEVNDPAGVPRSESGLVQNDIDLRPLPPPQL